LDAAPEILANLGKVLVELGRFSDALDKYRRSLDPALGPLAPETRLEIEKRIVELTTPVSVTFNVDAAGIELCVDGQVVGLSPLVTPVSLTPGSHVVSWQGPDVARGNRPLNVAPRRSNHVSIHVETTPHSSAIRSYVWGLAGVFATTAVVTGAFALRASHDQSERLANHPAARSELERGANQVKTLADWTTALTIAAGATALSAWLLPNRWFGPKPQRVAASWAIGLGLTDVSAKFEF
jgi:hypothetical protein